MARLRKFHWFHFVLAGATIVLGAQGLKAAQDKRFEELDSLLTQGAREQQACWQFEQDWEGLAKLTNDNLRPGSPHSSKELALKVLAALEKRPGWAPSYEKAMTYLFENGKSLGESWQLPQLTRWSQLEFDCKPLVLMRELPRLFASSTVHRFGKEETARVRALAERYLLGTHPMPAFIENGIRNTILHAYLERFHRSKRRGELLQRSKAFDQRFEQARGEISERARELNPELPTTQGFRFEMERSRELAKELAALIQEAIR